MIKVINRSTCTSMKSWKNLPVVGLIPVALVQLLFASLLIVAYVPAHSATPLSVVHTINDLWSTLATRAATETIAAVRKNSKIELELQAVPMETFQILVGRQHHLGLEVDGVTYDLLLGNEQDAVKEARKRAAAATASMATAAAAATAATATVPGVDAAPATQALPAGPTAGIADSTTTVGAQTAATILPVTSDSSEVAPLQRFSGPSSSRTLELPETTFEGPVELLLSVPEPVSIFSPLAADVGGPVRRVLIESGVTVRVAGLQRISLRRPLDLPRLPGQYLAEVYAQATTGEAEEGFESAPGILFLAERLRKAAETAANKSRSSGRQGNGPAPAVVSLELETVAPGALTITSAPELPPPYTTAAAPRLKVRRIASATVELSLRQGQLTPADTFNPAALSRQWAWPLPHIDSSSWLPYEALLRSVLASHPFNIDRVIQRGIGLRLTKSAIQGVHLIAFDMEVRAKSPRPPELEGSPYQWNENPLEIWEAVVQVQPQTQTQTQMGETSSSSSSSSSNSGGGTAEASGFRFVPLHVKRKRSFQNTLTMSPSTQFLTLTGGLNGYPGQGDLEVD